MPMSQKAFESLKVVVEWNPVGAKALLAILREYPQWVKYKEDLYGPLGLILYGVPPRKELGNGVSLPIAPAPFPAEKLVGCEIFGREWLQRRFSKSELAEALESVLAQL